MKKEFNRGEHSGYSIGNNISIHGHTHDPESWHLTIRQLNIIGATLCKKTCTEQEIARYVHLVLNKRLQIIEGFITKTIEFT